MRLKDKGWPYRLFSLRRPSVSVPVNPAIQNYGKAATEHYQKRLLVMVMFANAVSGAISKL